MHNHPEGVKMGDGPVAQTLCSVSTSLGSTGAGAVRRSCPQFRRKDLFPRYAVQGNGKDLE